MSHATFGIYYTDTLVRTVEGLHEDDVRETVRLLNCAYQIGVFDERGRHEL
jgi:hypothetical protein